MTTTRKQVKLEFWSTKDKLPSKADYNKNFVCCLIIDYHGRIGEAVWISQAQAFWSAQFKNFVRGVLYWKKIERKLKKDEIDAYFYPYVLAPEDAEQQIQEDREREEEEKMVLSI